MQKESQIEVSNGVEIKRKIITHQGTGSESGNYRLPLIDRLSVHGSKQSGDLRLRDDWSAVRTSVVDNRDVNN